MKKILLSMLCCLSIFCISSVASAEVSKTHSHKWCQENPHKCKAHHRRVKHSSWCSYHPRHCQYNRQRTNEREFLEEHK